MQALPSERGPERTGLRGVVDGPQAELPLPGFANRANPLGHTPDPPVEIRLRPVKDLPGIVPEPGIPFFPPQIPQLPDSLFRLT